MFTGSTVIASYRYYQNYQSLIILQQIDLKSNMTEVLIPNSIES